MNKHFQNKQLRIGLVVNPYAGIGGEAALKGSDGTAIRQQALDYHHGNLRVVPRVRRFLQALGQQKTSIEWYTGKSLLGETFLHEYEIIPTAVFGDCTQLTNAEDTRFVVGQYEEKKVDLILFVGGDGTARDVFDAVKQATPCLGLPSGVKMQSGVFALSPESAAEIVLDILAAKLVTVTEQDVRDIDEAALRDGRVRSKYYGSLQVPSAPLYLQHLKQGGVEDETLVLQDIASHLDELMEEGHLLIVGPGRTLAFWMDEQHLPNTLVGFDAVLDGCVMKSDLNAIDLIQLQNEYPDLLLLLSPTGQQGILIGRGNQQLTPDFLKAVPKPQWKIIATKNKLAAFNGKSLIVDSNDVEVDRQLCGLYPIICAYHHEVLYPVNITYKNE